MSFKRETTVTPYLEPCQAHLLHGSLHRGAPDIHSYQGAIAIPKGFSHARREAGLYDRSGRLIIANAQHHGHPGSLKFQTPLTKPAHYSFLPTNPRAVFGGCVFDHYGHFITECLNTLWFTHRGDRAGRPVLLLSNFSKDELYALPWFNRIIGLIGLGKDDIVIPDYPVCFEQLVIPGQAFSEDDFIYTEYIEFCQAIGAATRYTPPPGDVFWASKTKLSTGNLLIQGEEEVQAHLERRGVTIIYPEELDFDTQVSIFASGKIETWFIGSTFHTSVFAKQPQGIALTPDAAVRRSFALTDALNGSGIDYLRLVHLEPQPNRPYYNSVFRIIHPQQVAEDLLRRIDERLGDSGSPSPVPPCARQPAEFKAYHLTPTSGGSLRADLFDGRLHVAYATMRWHTEIILLRSGPYGFLIPKHTDSPAISIGGEPYASPLLSYFVEDIGDGLIALRSPQAGAYVSFPPSGSAVEVQASGIDEWEKLTTQFDPALTSILNPISSQLTAALSGARGVNRFIRYAVSRFDPSPRALPDW